MSAPRDDELVAEAQERVMTVLDRTKEKVDAVIREAEEEVDRIRREVHAATGIDISGAPSPESPAVMDVQLGDLAILAKNCRHVLAVVELLGEHVRLGSTQTVGAVAKAGVDLQTAAAAVHHLQQSGFFAGEGDGS
ncbi:hypothetical protein [Streptomyces sp. NBC_00620]|uniref:hypothetical protein n=1 Tax=Streptomyces sp. NBC_00620 TaxID=2903666 RepID=UPI002255D7CE|nr:hypothetical protein [Streptomyces sp. NBC_00620]MCX4973154.1 hypothetical protein [Streptomyces sp. NBC_00620]